VRVILAEDSILLREGLVRLLAEEEAKHTKPDDWPGQ